ncbi:MAG: hypothetical protein ACM3OB_07350 [Acidobacteriota bacterium]
MSDAVTPIVVDLGKVGRKRVKQLKRGDGPLLEEVHQVIANVRESLGPEAAGRELVPVVMLYRRKRRRPK